jgi:hypothetical protein
MWAPYNRNLILYMQQDSNGRSKYRDYDTDDKSEKHEDDIALHSNANTLLDTIKSTVDQRMTELSTTPSQSTLDTDLRRPLSGSKHW